VLAGQALRRGLILVTASVTEFARATAPAARTGPSDPAVDCEDKDGRFSCHTRVCARTENLDGSLGTVLAWGGRAEEAIEQTETALRLNPRDPSNFFRIFVNALAHFTAGRYADAAAAATRSLRSKRIFRIPYLVRIAALALSGDLDRARAAANDMRIHVPAVTRAYVDQLPFVRAEHRAALLRGLSLAGLLDPRADGR
jgi:tetratricopeptide (TPR) repeat protein